MADKAEFFAVQRRVRRPWRKFLDSFDENESFFKHAHMEFPAIGFGTNPYWKTSDYQGETIVIGFRTLGGIEGINEFHRIKESDGKLSAMQCYCFCPDTLRTVADEPTPT